MQTIKDTTGFPDQQNDPRVNQQRMLPTAVPSRILGQIITGQPASSALGSGISSGIVTVPSGSSRSVLITTSDNFGRANLIVPDVAIYFSTISTATQWPNATQNMGNFPVSVFNDWGLTNNSNTVTRVQMYNNTGGSLDVLVLYRARMIVNPVSGAAAANV